MGDALSELGDFADAIAWIVIQPRTPARKSQSSASSAQLNAKRNARRALSSAPSSKSVPEVVFGFGAHSGIDDGPELLRMAQQADRDGLDIFPGRITDRPLAATRDRDSRWIGGSVGLHPLLR